MFTDRLAAFTDWQDAHAGQCLLFYMPWVGTSRHLLVSQFLGANNISMPSTSSTSVTEHQHAIHTHGLQVWGYIHNAAVLNQLATELIWNCWNVYPCEGLVVGGGGEESKVEVGRGYLMEFCPLLSFWSLLPFADYD